MTYSPYTQSQRFLATLLLFSFLLESCHNPNIGMGRRSISPPQEASGGNISPEEEPYDNSREQHTSTTAGNHPIESRQTATDSEQAQEQPGQQEDQAKRQESGAAAESEEPGQPSPAIIPQRPILADRTPQHTASQGFLAQGGWQGAGSSAGEPAKRDQHQGEPSTGKQEGASGSALRRDPPRAPELTRSKGPTNLEGAQQEVAGLKEKIAELYSNLPQATERADAKVVDELITHLKALLKLEGFWALAQDSDGAKEYIARLRETHRTKWGQTAYGASISKQLTGLLVKAWGQELKRVASARRADKQGKTIKSKTPDGAGRLAQVLDQLAALHQEQGEETGDLAYYTDAAILYQKILRICEKEQGYQEQIESAYMGLAKIRRDMLARVKGGNAGVVAQGDLSIANLQEEIARDKEVLKDLRADAKTRVAQLEALLSKQGSEEKELTYEKEYIAGSRALFSDIAKQVREFLARLYQESEEDLIPVLGPPPCKYTVIGLGSMALAQMTPYSDLNFAILMEEGNDEARAYLRQLTHLVHCRVINLGETVIPQDKYDINLDHLGKEGIKFDLGGKTPLGRKDKPYDLIQPVAGMLYYLRNTRDKIEHIDKHLPYILESTCYVHGDKELYSVYTREKNAFLKQEQSHKSRALRMLLEGVVEWDYSHPGIAKAKPKQPGNLAEFKPQFGLEDAGKLYDVKQEIYRLPDRLLYCLSMYYGLLPKSGWDAVEQLAGSGIIGVGEGAQEAAHHLQYAVSFATLLRLKTHLHHDQKGEHATMLSGISPEEAEQAVSKAFLLPPEDLQAEGSLFKYYYTAVPLHSKMKLFFEARKGKVSPREARGFFQEEPFYDASDATRGDIYRRLLQYKQAIACYGRALSIDEKVYGPEHPHVATSLNTLGVVWNELGDPKQAIECLKRALAIIEQAYGPEHPSVAMSLTNVGRAWDDLGAPKKAMEYFKRALAINEQVYGEGHPSVATTLNNLGRASDKLGDPKQAIECYERAKAINERTYGPEHPEVAAILTNLGRAWDQLGDPKKAIEYSEQALSINEKVYGPEHPSVAMSLTNLGRAWDDLGDPNKAIEYSERALEIRKKVYGEEHPSVAMSLTNLGRAWDDLGDPNKAMEYFKRALAISEKAYGAEHPRVATILNKLGLAWDQLGDLKKAIGYFEQALSINEQAYGPEHPQVAAILNNMGLAWDDLGAPKQAIEYHERAKAIYEQAYGPEHPHVATSLNNMGRAWYQLGDPKQAIECCERALEIRKKVYGEQHSDVATSLNNMGEAWRQLGDPKQAIEYLEQAKAIYEQVYGAEHPEVAMILNNLGTAWSALGDPKQASEYFGQALEIKKKVYGSEHPDVATSLNNMGEAWRQLGDPKQAIKYHKQALEISKKFYGEQHPDVASILNNLGTAWSALGDPKQAIEYLDQALSINEQVYGSEHPDVATRLNNLGSAWSQLGDPKEAIECFKRAKAINEKVYGLEHPKVATGLNNLGLAWEQLGDPKKAIEYYNSALTISKKAYGPEHPKVATDLNNLGSAWSELGDPKKAIECFKRALATNEKAYGPEHPAVAKSLNNLGLAWNQLGDPKQAIACCERALSINEQVYGEEHPAVAMSLNNLGLAWNQLGDPKQAIEYYEQALAITEQVYGPKHPAVANSLNDLGLAWNQLGDPKQAIEYYEQALAITEQVYGPKHPAVANSLNNLGSAWNQLGDSETAIECFKRAKAINEQVYGLEHPAVAASLNNLCEAWNKLGEPKRAIGYLNQAKSINDKVYGPKHPAVAKSLNNLGRAWDQLGDSETAIACFKRAKAIYEKVYGAEHPAVAVSLSNLGSTREKLGHFQEAIEFYKQAKAIYEQVYSSEHPEVATILHNLNRACNQLDDPKEAGESPNSEQAQERPGQQGAQAKSKGRAREQGDASGSDQQQALEPPQGHGAYLVTLQERIAQGDPTAEIIREFNDGQAEERQKELQQRIERYIKWFNKQPVGMLALTPEKIQEYTCLAHIKPTLGKNRQLLKSYFDSLYDKIDARYERLIQALEYTLQTIDSRVFEGQTAQLIELGDELFNKLDLKRNDSNKKNYPLHRSTLLALYHTFMLIQEIEGKWAPTKKKEAYRKLKAKIEELKDNAQYYPIRYHALLLKQSLQRLESCKDRSEDIPRRLRHGLKAMLYLYAGTLIPPYFKPNLDKLSNGCKHLQATCGPQGIQPKSWYDWLLDLSHATLLTLKDPNQYEDFKEQLQKLKDKSKRWMGKEDRTALCFGAVMQLGKLALDGPTDVVRKASIDWLSSLAKVEAWGGYGEVMETILESLATVVVEGRARDDRDEEVTQARKALEKLADSLSKTNQFLGEEVNSLLSRKKRSFHLAIKGWLDGKMVDKKLIAMPARAATPVLGGLFSEIDSLLRAEASKEYVMGPHLTMVSRHREVNTLLPPSAVNFFVGREQELEVFRKAFQANEQLIIAPPITGPAAIGKTQLALKVVKQQLEAVPYDYMFWIPAETEQKLLTAYLQLAQGLRIYDKEDEKQAVQTVRAYLKDKQCLYVFDDAPDIGMLREFLPLSKGHVLITSRNSDKGAWDTSSVQVHPLSEQEAFELAPKFGLAQQESTQKALKPLLSEVPRYPLTLVQLFSTLDNQGVSPQEFLSAMQDYRVKKEDQALLDLLSEDPHERVGYDKSTLYVFKASLEQLSKETQGDQALQLISQLAYLDPKGIPVDWLLSWDTEDSSPLKRKTRKALALLEKHSLIQWDRPSQQIYIHAETQLMARHLHPQASLTGLISSLVAYVGDEAEAPQNASKWSSLLPHGRILFERLAIDQYPQEAYILTKYLAAACSVGCLFKEGLSWAKECLAIAQKRYPDQDHPDVAYALDSVGGSLRQVGQHQEALECFKRSLAINEQVYGEQHPDVAISLNNLGSAWSALGDPKKAREYHKRSLEIRKKVYGEQHPSVASSLNNLGGAWNQLGNPKKAIEYYKRAKAIDEKVYGQKHPVVATSLNGLGRAWDKLGDPKKAIGYFERALDINEKVYGEQHPDVAMSLNNMGNAWYKLGNPKQAIEYYEQAKAINEQAYGEEHPDVAMSLNNMGNAWYKLGDPKKASEYYEQAKAIYEQVYGEKHPEVATNLNNLGTVWYKLGDPKKAIEYLERALAIYEKFYGEEHPRVAAKLNNLGSAWSALGDPKQAIEYHKQALEIRKKVHGEQHPGVATSLNNMGEAWRQLGDPKQGIECYKRALAIYEQVYGPEHPSVATSLNNIGGAWDRLGDHKQAIEYLEQAFHIMKKVYGEDHPSTQEIKRNVEQLSQHLANNLEYQTKQFVQACVRGNENLAKSISMGSLEKDLYDEQGSALIAWMAQHEMMATLEEVLNLGWNPNLPNKSQIYPLHYGAMKSPGLTKLLLQEGAHPFVQTAKGNTPAQVARNKGKVSTLAVLLPSLERISFKDITAFEENYQTHKQGLPTGHQDDEELLMALELALQLGDTELTLAIQAKQGSQKLLEQLIAKYPLAKEAIQARFENHTKESR